MNILQICYKYPPRFSGYGKQLHTVNLNMLEKSPKAKVSVITAYGSNNSGFAADRLKVLPLFSSKRVENKFIYYLFCVVPVFRWVRLFYKSNVVHIVKA